MYIIKNAFKNFFRNKGRNILMGAIILAIIATSTVALIINTTATGIIDSYKEQFGAEVTLSPNMQKLQEQAVKGAQNGQYSFENPVISAEQYIAFGNSEHLRDAVYSAEIGIFKSGGIIPIDEESGGDTRMSARDMQSGKIPFDSTEFNLFAKLIGFNHEPEEFKSGYREIAGGRFPESENECILSRDLLENSGLQIGDTLDIRSMMRRGEDTAEISYTLKIVGFYDDITEEYSGERLQNSYYNRRNEIITTYNTVISQMQENMDGMSVDGTYYLKNPDLLEAFADELYEKGLGSIWDVKTDESGYNMIVKPVEGLKSTTFAFLIVIIILGAAVMVLLSSIAIRERKYEIGVLRAMGMKKSKVAFGLLSEIIMITLVCLIVGLGVGTAVAQPVSDTLLENQIEQIQVNTVNDFGYSIGETNAPTVEMLETMDVGLNRNVIIQIILVSLLLAASASVAGITRVTKYEPIKILMERN